MAAACFCRLVALALIAQVGCQGSGTRGGSFKLQGCAADGHATASAQRASGIALSRGVAPRGASSLGPVRPRTPASRTPSAARRPCTPGNENNVRLSAGRGRETRAVGRQAISVLFAVRVLLRVPSIGCKVRPRDCSRVLRGPAQRPLLCSDRERERERRLVLSKRPFVHG